MRDARSLLQSNLIRIEERIEQRILLANQRAEIVGEQTVEADVLKSQLSVALFELGLPVRSQRQWSVAAADGMLPTMWKGRADL